MVSYAPPALIVVDLWLISCSSFNIELGSLLLPLWYMYISVVVMEIQVYVVMKTQVSSSFSSSLFIWRESWLREARGLGRARPWLGGVRLPCFSRVALALLPQWGGALAETSVLRGVTVSLDLSPTRVGRRCASLATHGERTGARGRRGEKAEDPVPGDILSLV